MRMHTLSARLVMISLLAASKLLGAEISSLPSDPPIRCESKVYVFIDRSASVNPTEKRHLAENLGAALTSSKDHDTVIADHKYISLFPFAGNVGAAKIIPTEAKREDILSMINDGFRGAFDTGDLLPSQSDFVKVLKEISAIAKRGSQTNMVFIIASDFVHDVTAEDDRSSQDQDREHWKKSILEEEELWRSLLQSFGDSSKGNVLLLLPREATGDRIDIAGDVLAKLEELTPYEDQITAKGSLNLESLLKYLQPFSIKQQITQHNGEYYHEVTIEKRSCLRVPPLKVKRSRINENGFVEYERHSDGLFKSKLPPPRPLNHTGLDRLPGLDFILQVQLEENRGGDDLQVERINMDQYVFLSDLSIKPGDDSQSFEGRARFRQVYWDRDISVTLKIMDGDKEIGTSNEISIPSQPDVQPRLVAKEDISIKIKDHYLPQICYDPEWKGRAKLSVVSYTSGAVVQEYPLDINIRNHDNQHDLLENLAQQGSLPAFFTLLTLICMFAWRRAVGMGQVEEALAVVGVFWLTAFLLAHHIDKVGRRMDDFLLGKRANLVGMAICLLLAWLILILLRKGAFVPTKDSAEIKLEVENRALRSRMPERQIGFWPRSWHFLTRGPASGRKLGYVGVILILLATAAIGAGLILGNPGLECVLEVGDEIGNYI